MPWLLRLSSDEGAISGAGYGIEAAPDGHLLMTANAAVNAAGGRALIIMPRGQPRDAPPLDPHARRLYIESMQDEGAAKFVRLGCAWLVAASAAAAFPCVEGVVVDPEGGPVSGIRISTGLRLETTTDADGRFRFAVLPVGEMVLWARSDDASPDELLPEDASPSLRQRAASHRSGLATCRLAADALSCAEVTIHLERETDTMSCGTARVIDMVLPTDLVRWMQLCGTGTPELQPSDPAERAACEEALVHAALDPETPTELAGSLLSSVESPGAMRLALRAIAEALCAGGAAAGRAELLLWPQLDRLYQLDPGARDAAIAELVPTLAAASARTRGVVVGAVGEADGPAAERFILAALRDDEPWVRLVALEAWGGFEESDVPADERRAPLWELARGWVDAVRSQLAQFDLDCEDSDVDACRDEVISRRTLDRRSAIRLLAEEDCATQVELAGLLLDVMERGPIELADDATSAMFRLDPCALQVRLPEILAAAGSADQDRRSSALLLFMQLAENGLVTPEGLAQP